MFKNQLVVRLAVLAVVITAGGFLLSCSNEVTTPVGNNQAEGRATAIYGRVYSSTTGLPISGATVEWYCSSHNPWVFIDDDTTDGDGRYDIEEFGSSHDKHTLIGIASKNGYKPASNVIELYDSGNIPYRRDFGLDPDD
jgi:hypothetical protein